MAGILDMLFGQQQQPQPDQGGLAQSILSQRFQPNMQDVGNSTVQSVIGKMPTPYDAMQQRMAAGMGGEQMQQQDIANQMALARLQYMQSRLGGTQPSMGLPQGQTPQNDSMPPVGFQNQPQGGDPRYNQAINDAFMFDPTQVPKVEMSQIENDPNVVRQKKTAEAQGADIETAQKGVVGIDSRLQNAVNILNDQIQLAPKTMSGSLGQFVVGSERNAANFGIKSETPAAQTLFEQNNANLFTQELPAIMAGMPGSRMDIPLINAIKQASSVNQNGTVDEKVKAAQNLKALLMKYQKNTHNYAQGMGAGDTPIQSVSDVNPVGFPPSDSSQGNTGLDASDPRVQTAREHGYSDDEIQQFLMKGPQ